MTIVLLCILACLALPVFSTVTVVESLDEQLPSVARVNQPYSWTFSPSTFSSTDGSLRYTTSSLPGWLLFDDNALTFSGTPTKDDEGYREITVTAHGTSSSTSSRFSLCVTEADPPALSLPLAEQFRPKSRSLSSVFFLHNNSAISTPNPTLRVPRKWSFSIGFESGTYMTRDGRDVYYELRFANGSAIPDYLSFDSKTVTLDGVIPSADDISQPYLLSFNLHVSDQEGYTAVKEPFNLMVADHELSLDTASLPTINVTRGDQFIVGLLSPVDFTGLLVDGDPIQPSNISSLEIDTSAYPWLTYDQPSRTLSGSPGSDDSPTLPVTIRSVFNQSISTQVSLALVDPYFISPELPPLNVSKGDQIQFDLSRWFFSSTANPANDQTAISVSFDPTTAANFLRYDSGTSFLNGNVPSDYTSTLDHITVTFTAYSSITHSTSHSKVEVYIPTSNGQSLAPAHPSGLSTEAHERLVLALTLTFGILGGLCLLAGIFSLFRKCARVEDSAVLGEEGRAAWSEKDRRWYGLTLSPGGTRVIERNTGLFSPGPQVAGGGGGGATAPPPGLPVPSSMGLDLRRVSERSHQAAEEVIAPAVMSKKEFLARIKETVRQVSDKYNSRRQRSPALPRPVIGKPILVASTRSAAHDRVVSVVPENPSPEANPFEDTVEPSRPNSTLMTGSPSASTMGRSIPRRRPDFAPPKNPAQVHFNDGLLARQPSTGSVGATSSISAVSHEGESTGDMGPPTKPRLVPFTPSNRVPVPQAIGIGLPIPEGTSTGAGFVGNRITSQRAKVCKVDSQDVIIEEGSVIKTSGTSDELSMGMHYVRSLGADQLTVHSAAQSGGKGSSGIRLVQGAGPTGPRSPALSNVRSSFTSLESSHLGNKSGTDADVTKVVVRAGERFKFRLSLPSGSTDARRKETKGYYVKMTSGQPLPKFMQADLSAANTKGVVELSGVPALRDMGEVAVGVYGQTEGTCIARAFVEVVGKR